MSDQPIESDSSDQIIVTVEQADALLEMIASDENAGRISSAALSSGLVSLGLAGANGLAGDAARILEPVRAARTQIAIRVVSPSMRGIVRDWRIWPSRPRSVVMRAQADGVHFAQVDDCDVPRILAEESLLEPGPTIHDGPPWISADFVQAVRDVDLERAQSALIDVAAKGPSDSHFSQDCWHKRWSVVLCVREDRTRDRWKDAGHVECFITDHMHAQIHAPLDPRALALMRERNAPTLNAPPRTALWGFLMELLAK